MKELEYFMSLPLWVQVTSGAVLVGVIMWGLFTSIDRQVKATQEAARSKNKDESSAQ